MVAMAHPYVDLVTQAGEEGAVLDHFDICRAVFTASSLFKGAPQDLCNELHPVADAQDRYPGIEEGGVHAGMVRIHDRARPSGEHDGFRVELP